MSDRSPAPALPARLKAVNFDEPISLEQFRGKVVLLHFFSHTLVQCREQLPRLRELQNRYDDGLVIVGIHSPKYPQERVPERLKRAMSRLYVRHIVLNDADFEAWRAFGIEVWPSLIVLDVHGRVAARMHGEDPFVALDDLISRLLEESVDDEIRDFSPSPNAFRPEPRRMLRYPTRLLVTDQYLYIADTGYNRVLECDHRGVIQRIFGTGNAGYWDGGASDAGFREPQGLALVGEYLYIADTGNHCIRRVRMHSGEVDTVIGTARAGRQHGTGFPNARHVPLTCPVGLSAWPDRVLLTVEGQNQIWIHDLVKLSFGVHIGSGLLGLRDGAANEAVFAQPTGICHSTRTIFVADSESSSIRTIRVADGRVSTVVGRGLYEYGHRDGPLQQALLTRPTGLCTDDSGTLLWVADSYNDAIRLIDTRLNTASTLRLDHPLVEPTDVVRRQNSLYVTNTGAHEIVRIDLVSGAAEVIEIRD